MRWHRIVALGLLFVGVVARPPAASGDNDRLLQELKGVVPGLPFAGQGKHPPGFDARGGSYAVEGPISAVDYPASDEKPPHMTFGVNWKTSASGGKPQTPAELDKAWQDSKSGGLPKNGEDGALGSHTWMLTTVTAGTNDPNFSGDPYMAYSQGFALTECGILHVAVSIGIYSHASHGARNKPAVLEALKKGAAAHLKNVFGQFLAVMRYGCSGDAAPPEPPSASLVAEPACASVRLVRGKLPSEECGIYVRNWPANRAVSTCFPALQDAWGLLPNGIIATFANEYFHVGAVVAKGRTSGEFYLPIWWYARCQAVPGVHMVEVNVQEGGPVGTIGGCPSASNRTTVRIAVEVLEEMSPNCTVPPTLGTGGATGGGAGMSGGSGGGTGGGGAGPGVVGRWTTNFGDLVLADAGNGTARGTLGSSGVVVIGKVKDGEFVGTYADGNGDGLIHLVSPDGTTMDGEWKRSRGPDAGKSGRIHGRRDPRDAGTGSGTGPGMDGGGGGDLPGGGTGGGTGGTSNEPGGPGTGERPPQRPIPAPLTGLTLQAPELRVSPGQEVPVSIWLLNADDVVNMNWELVFDPAVATASTAAGSVGKGNLLTEAFEANPSAAGWARMGFAQKKGIRGTGIVSVHKLKIVGAVGTRTPLRLVVPMISDSRPKTLPITILEGWIEVVAPGSGTPGSAGGQAGPTLQDAYNALKMSVGLLPVNLALDVDRDGKITSLDAWLIMTTVFLTMKEGK